MVRIYIVHKRPIDILYIATKSRALSHRLVHLNKELFLGIHTFYLEAAAGRACGR